MFSQQTAESKTSAPKISALKAIAVMEPVPQIPVMPEPEPPEPPDPTKPVPPRPDPPKDKDRIFNYRGNRTYSQQIPLIINNVKCGRLNEQEASVEIIFNMKIDPRSVVPECIFINGVPLSDTTQISFNKKADY